MTWIRLQEIITVDTARLQEATKEHSGKRSGKRNLGSGLQVQLEKNGGDSKRRNWTQTSGV